jgi:hypothetical protein
VRPTRIAGRERSRLTIAVVRRFRLKLYLTPGEIEIRFRLDRRRRG